MALIHIANVAVSSALLGLLSLVMFKNPQLQTSDSNIDLAYVKGVWASTGMMFVAFVLALVFAPLKFSALFVQFLQTPIEFIGRRRVARS